MVFNWSAKVPRREISSVVNKLTGTKVTTAINAHNGPVSCVWGEKVLEYASGSRMHDVYGIGRVEFIGNGGAVTGSYINKATGEMFRTNIVQWLRGKKQSNNIRWFDTKGEQIANMIEDGGMDVFKKYIAKVKQRYLLEAK